MFWQRLFAAQSCRVVMTGRDLTKVQAKAEKMGRKRTQVLTLACDISRREHVQHLEKEISAHRGAMQILINNASVARAVNSSDMPEEL
jgi:short-subunit dehydrogenase